MPNSSRSSSGSPPSSEVDVVTSVATVVGLDTSAAILGGTMGEKLPRDPDQPVTPEQQQSIAHARGRICKVRQCEVCAPLRETRRLKKAERKVRARAQLQAKPPQPATPVVPRGDDPGEALRRQTERHRVGLPCGSESCPSQVCVDGFAQERARRHRARRPCRSISCDNPICAASRSGT